MMNEHDFGPLPPAPKRTPTPTTREEALNQLAYGDRGTVDRDACLAMLRDPALTAPSVTSDGAERVTNEELAEVARLDREQRASLGWATTEEPAAKLALRRMAPALLPRLAAEVTALQAEVARFTAATRAIADVILAPPVDVAELASYVRDAIRIASECERESARDELAKIDGALTEAGMLEIGTTIERVRRFIVDANREIERAHRKEEEADAREKERDEAQAQIARLAVDGAAEEARLTRLAADRLADLDMLTRSIADILRGAGVTPHTAPAEMIGQLAPLVKPSAPPWEPLRKAVRALLDDAEPSEQAPTVSLVGTDAIDALRAALDGTADR